MAVSLPALNAEDRVKAVAYSLWLEEGRPDGRAEAHWFKAVELVSADAPAADAKPKRKAAPRKKAAA